jgi:hypothetical protein
VDFAAGDASEDVKGKSGCLYDGCVVEILCAFPACFSCATLYVNVTFYVSMLLQLAVLLLTFSYLFKQSMLLGLQADMLRDG